jgi:hypothetical protein
MPHCYDCRTRGRGFVWRGGNGLSSSRRCIAASAWLLAAGLLVSAGGATAFADPGAGGTKGAGSSSAAKGNGAGGGSGTRRNAATAGASQSKHDETGTTSRVRQRSALRPSIDESDPVTKPTTLITRSATVALGAHQFSADADSVTDSTSANDVARSGDETGPTDAGPTSEVASPPTTNEVQPSPTDTPPTDDPAPSPVASTEVTSDTAVPVIPVNDASEAGSDASGSDPTAASTAPTVVAQGTSQDASDSSNTASGPNQTPSDTGVTTVLEALLSPTTEAVAPPAVLADVAPLLETIVNTVELMSDDENAQRRSDHDRPALSPLQILRLMTQTSGSSLAGEATEIPMLSDGSNQTRSNSTAFAPGTNNALAGTSSTTPVAARIQPDAALPEGLQTFLHTYGGIIVAVSLSAMFAAALPGLIGLAIPVVAGMGIGYRQAKSGRALHTSGIAHLAPSGPIGVVRSGRLIALRSQRVPTPNNADLAQEVA